MEGSPAGTGMDSLETSGTREPAVPWWRRKLRAVPVIIGINGVVFVLWQLARSSRDMLEFMAANFLVSAVHLQHGLYWTLLTSVFSHEALWHFAINMIVLYSFGAILARVWGKSVFTGFYLVAGLAGSVGHVVTCLYVLHDPRVSALGASGAIAGLLMAYAMIFPRQRILIMGFIPVPAWAGVAALVAWDLWGLLAQSHGGGLPIGHGAHLGGAVAGAVMVLLFRRQLEPEHVLMPVGPSRAEVRELERIRAKLEAEGPQSLTPEEARFLAELRRRYHPPSQ